MKNNDLTDVSAFLLIVLFTYTAVSKFLHQQLFVLQMSVAPMPVMKTAAPYLGWIIPAIEVLIVAGLLTNRFRLKSFYASLLLLTAFEIYIAGMLLTGLRLPCSCGGAIAKLSWKQHLLFNALFIGISLIPVLIKSFARKNRRTVACL